MDVIVLKFGGSCLANPEKIRLRAQQIKSFYDQGLKVITVVSAMGNQTNELVNLAYKVSPTPHRRELDMLLTTGERISMALLSMALNDLHCPAISFTGSQAGVLTEEHHNHANIKEIKPIRVEQELSNDKVVIIAGFQGVNPITKEVTTLGRGGSDTTAMAFAKHFKGRCYIFKDVPGVCSADPNKYHHAQTFKQ
ncbi:MAG: aspartate kinase, partial [Bdellovibrionales bacterium]|nr:aspartate kinase [Bdellovibrionales bacterium]